MGIQPLRDSRESSAVIGVWVLCGFFFFGKGNSAEIGFFCVCLLGLPTSKARILCLNSL